MSARFISQNHALRYIEEGKKSDRFRDCGHLQLAVGAATFIVQCDRDSFEGSADDFEPDFRAGALGPYCPDDCRLFLSSRQHQRALTRERWMSRLWAPFRLLPRPFKWFSSAPWQTQVLLLLVTLFFLAPRFLDALADLVRAYKGP